MGVVKSFSFNNKRYEIRTLSGEDYRELERYCSLCAEEGVVNNSSPQAMKINRWDDDQWWVTYDVDTKRIVSAVGCHPLFEFKENCWRVMFRMATIKSYRSKAGPISKDQRSCFGWGRVLPLQIEYCRERGAEQIVFTTNCSSDGNADSLRQNRVCELVFEKLGMARKVATAQLYNVEQNIWEVLIEDVYSKKRLSL